MTKKKSRTSHHVTQIFLLSIFLNCEQKKYIWLKKLFLIFAENGRKSLKVFDNWLRTGKNYLG